MYNTEWTRKAKKDYDLAVKNGYRAKIAEILRVIERNPYEDTQGHFYEELKGELKGTHTRRINYHNRFAYEVLPNNANATHPETGEIVEGIVKVTNMWGHFPNLKR